MDSVVKVRRSFMNEIRGFLNMFAGACNGCFRSPCDCANRDVILRAKSLVGKIDVVRDAKEEEFFRENPNEELFRMVETAIRQAGRPVRSEEISLGRVRRQKKSSVLKALLLRHRITMSVIYGVKFYDLPCNNNTNTQTKGTR